MSAHDDLRAVQAECRRLRTNGPGYEGNVTYAQFVSVYDALATALERLEAAEQDAQVIAHLMYGSPAMRLAYCQKNSLLPPVNAVTGRYPDFACVDSYWRTAIAAEVLVGRHLAREEKP